MRKMHTQNTNFRRSAFTLVELLVVVVIAGIVLALGASAYMRFTADAKDRAAAQYLNALAGAIQVYQNQNRTYPPARFVAAGFQAGEFPPATTGKNQPNLCESMEVLLYSLEYNSDAGDVLKRLPSQMMRPRPGVVKTGPSGSQQDRPLNVVVDPWGTPIQYVYPVGLLSLGHPILLVSMGPDGRPGQLGANGPDDGLVEEIVTGSNTWYPDWHYLGQGDDIVVQVGVVNQ